MSKQAKKLFKFLKNKKTNDLFSLDDMGKASGYKIGSIRTKKNHCLKNVYITEKSGKFSIIKDKINRCNEKEFLQQISEKKENTKEKSLVDHLIENSKAFILSAIELHNKPNFPYRYEIVSILVISAWEKLLKAHILKLEINNAEAENRKTTIEKLINKLKSYPNQKGLLITDESSRIKNIKTIGESIKSIKDYRNNSTHFYNQKDVDHVVLNLIFKNIILYCGYLKDNFDLDILKENDLFLLPIGIENYEKSFKRIFEEKHKNTVFQDYINKLKRTIENLKREESILIDLNYSIGKKGEYATEFILSNKGQKIKLTEEDIREKYPHDSKALTEKLKKLIPDFLQNKKYYSIKKKLQGTEESPNKTFAFYRKLDIQNKRSPGKWFYNGNIINEIKKNMQDN